MEAKPLSCGGFSNPRNIIRYANTELYFCGHPFEQVLLRL